MAPAEKARWKRVWWCLYVRDRQISLSTGSPMVINDADHDVEELVPEDLPDETPETVRYLIGQIGLNKIGKFTRIQLIVRWILDDMANRDLFQLLACTSCTAPHHDYLRVAKLPSENMLCEMCMTLWKAGKYQILVFSPQVEAETASLWPSRSAISEY
jgi:hypothetical protein